MTKSYGQFCPVATAAEIICERWTALIIRELVSGSESFNDIRMGVTRISPSLLSTRLKTLEHAGVIQRISEGHRVCYRLTDAGKDLGPVIMAMGVWGQRWARSDMSRKHLDPGYLMWDIRRRIDTRYFPGHRVVIQFEFTDYAARQRRWWLVIKDGDVDLCRSDPGYEIQLYISSRLKTLTQVWMGDLSLSHVRREKRINLAGDRQLLKSISSWFSLSIVADIKAGVPGRQKRHRTE